MEDPKYRNLILSDYINKDSVEKSLRKYLKLMKTTTKRKLNIKILKEHLLCCL